MAGALPLSVHGSSATPPCCWRYSQSTGRLLDPDGVERAVGYSGAPEARNDGTRQAERGVGPIPRGRWRIGPPYDGTRAGRGGFVLPLLPLRGTITFGRSGFLCHGDSRAHPGTASRGCIILDHATRELIWASGVRDLVVVP
jgi:hypothetical protein